ncbi:TauD/TfdA family dioxygenase [Siccirubricoccus sp. KC 17139]|uniref:TauD/TfdA family dioxygenase n=1 Tax=Siccirubricoccus soli TaxID=2899147 RepID=A0ABT1D7S6_9PROT|nr:TauD/TfdA family dioxygenase [Siccirubricoccus soli]MCO6417978.1 TauD/TfdA family dioxygenase [Siccirubricoccus soli]MCP2684113.1 TauD/TfdA family dioxygenase [Siccirubricoccus soli]
MNMMPAPAELRPVSGPFVWYGPEMARRTDWIRPLSPAEVDELETAVRRLDATGIDIAAIGPEDLRVPGLAPLVEHIRRAVLHGTGFILVRGVPVDRWSVRQCAIAYFGLGTMLGEPVSQNAKGHILGHVKDIGADYAQPTARGYQTAARLPYHTDSSDIVALLCLKPSKAGGLSSIASSAAIYNEMLKQRPDLAAELAKPLYRDRRGEVPEGGEEWYAVPAFNPMPGGGLITTYVRSAMRKAQRFPAVPRITPQLDAACDLFDQLAESPGIHLDMEFRPGDIQFLNNHWIAHSRTAYEDFPEPGRRRHLLRLWLACEDGPPLPEVYLRTWQGATRKGRPAGIRVPGVRLNAPLDAE